MINNKSCEEKTDEELAMLVLENQAFFACLIERYQQKLLAYILRISNFSMEEAEDILQEVFIKVYKNLNEFDSDLKFSSWIYRITHNQVISAHRKTQSRPQGDSIDADDEILRKLASGLDTSSEISIKILRENIDKVMLGINVKYREVLVLRFFEEKDYKEISDIIRKPMGTVATLLNRAKDAFRKEMDRQNISL
jgi:RNA polymerase sigma-70 factor (ECF subfamily)